MDNNIIETAKKIMLNSDVMNYISAERLEEAFSHVTLAKNEKEFFKKYGNGPYRGEKLEG